MLEMKLTRFFTCEGVNAAYSLSFNITAEKDAADTLAKFKTLPVELPPMGKSEWREMTDTEAADYMKECAEDEKRARREAEEREYEEDDF